MSLQGWIKLLNQMVLKLPNISNLKSLIVLRNEDGEVNFFDDIADSVVCFWLTINLRNFLFCCYS